MYHRQFLSKTVFNLTSVFRRPSCSLNRTFSEKSTQNYNVPQEARETELSKLLEDAATFSEAKDTNWMTNPYPETAPVNQQKEPKKEKVLPNDNSILLFPGQGVLKVGTVQQYLRFPRVKELFSIANEILDYDLLKLCMQGPQKQLDKTEFNQPATIVVSLAALEKLIEERPSVLENCRAVGGYSLGELTALIFSGAIDFESGIKLVKIRAKAMEKASEQSKQGMLFVYTKPEAKIDQICKDAEAWARDLGINEPVCRVAIYLYTQTKILAGNDESLRYIQENSSKLGLRKVTRLPVSGAFHTPLMQPAVEPFKNALNGTVIEEPRVSVLSNYSVKRYRDQNDIRKGLLKQLVNPVKWEQTLQKLYNRPPGSTFPRTFDLGSGGQLKTILKNVNSKAYDWCYSV